MTALRRKLGDNAKKAAYIFTEFRVGYRMPKGEAQTEPPRRSWHAYVAELWPRSGPDQPPRGVPDAAPWQVAQGATCGACRAPLGWGTTGHNEYIRGYLSGRDHPDSSPIRDTTGIWSDMPPSRSRL